MHADSSDRSAVAGTARRRPFLFLLLAGAVLAILGLALLAVMRSTEPAAPSVTLTPTAPSSPSVASAPEVAPNALAPTAALTPDVQIPEAGEPPLPALEHSDPEVRATLSDMLPALAQPALAPDELLRRAAVCLSNFRRGKLVRDKLPLPAPTGRIAIVQREDRIFLDPANFARYDALAQAVAELDVNGLAKWFTRYEPLFAAAWKELAADGDARGALVAGLEIMLASPEPGVEIELVQPSVLYRFADPALESLPDSQKLLIRIGPANREILLRQARELRDALATTGQ